MVNRVLAKNFNFLKDSLMEKLKFEDLLVSGAHYGHVTRKWHPNYKPFILMEKMVYI